MFSLGLWLFYVTISHCIQYWSMFTHMQQAGTTGLIIRFMFRVIYSQCDQINSHNIYRSHPLSNAISQSHTTPVGIAQMWQTPTLTQPTAPRRCRRNPVLPRIQAEAGRRANDACKCTYNELVINRNVNFLFVMRNIQLSRQEWHTALHFYVRYKSLASDLVSDQRERECCVFLLLSWYYFYYCSCFAKLSRTLNAMSTNSIRIQLLFFVISARVYYPLYTWMNKVKAIQRKFCQRLSINNQNAHLIF